MDRILGGSLAQTIRDTQESASDFSVVPIQDRGDWSQILEPMEYVSANEIAFVDQEVDASRYFSIGRKLWIDQTTNKYFWISRVKDYSIEIDGGDNYTFLNTPVTAIYYSTQDFPNGWPNETEFFHQVTVIPVSGSVSSYLKRNCYFSMRGNEVIATYDVAATLSTGNIQVFLTLPIDTYTVLSNRIVGNALGVAGYSTDGATNIVWNPSFTSESSMFCYADVSTSPPTVTTPHLRLISFPGGIAFTTGPFGSPSFWNIEVRYIL